MAQTAVNQDLSSNECVTATIHDYVCLSGHCHNTTTSLHNCVDWDLNPDCANYTAHIDTCNATSCHNTTRHIHICVHDIADRCANSDIKIDCCTNGDCRNRTTTIHACNTNINVVGATACAATILSPCGIVDGDDAAAIRAATETSCVDSIVTSFRRALGP